MPAAELLDVVELMSRARLLPASAAVALLTVACTSTTQTTALVVTVESDAALALDQVVLVASASGRANVTTTFQAVPASLAWTIRLSGVSAELEVSVTATGRSGGKDVVSTTAVAAVVPGQSRDVLLKLSAKCAGPQAPTCGANEMCSDGACVPKPTLPANDGGTDGRGPDAVANQDAGGERCTRDNDCASGHCTDGVCCNDACQGGCMSCLGTETDGATGTCLPVTSGTSDGTCTAKPEATCKETGACDGHGACEMQPTTVECMAESCATGSYTAPGKCSGGGACVVPPATSCGHFACDGSQRCKATCNIDADCAAGAFCSAPGGTCVGAVCMVDGWCWHNPRPHGLPISDLWGPAPNDLWAVAPEGAIAHWDGTVWQGFTSVTADALNAVHGAGGVVWAVGGGGAILKWDGLAWRKVSSGTTADLRGVWAAGASDAWAMGPPGIVLRWNGTTWTSSTLPGASNLVGVAVSGRSTTDVWAATADAVFHFDGQSWTKDAAFTTTLFQQNMGITDLLVDPAGEVWVSGANDSETGSIVHRNSQGWTLVGMTDADDLSVLARSPSGRMWQAGIHGAVYSWNPGEAPTVVTGLDQGTPGLESGNLGTAIAVFSDSDVFIAGATSVSHWNGTALTDTFTGPRDVLYGISALPLAPNLPPGDEVGVVGGDTATLTHGVSYESTGGPWKANRAPASARPLRDVTQQVVSVAFAVGDGLEVLNGSLDTWQVMSAPNASTDTLTAMDNVNGSWWAVGSRGLLRTFSGGIYSTNTPSGTTANLNDVVMIGSTDVWAVGASGTVIHKAGTAAFTTVTVPTTSDLNGICANSAQDLWIVGNNGVVLHGNGTTFSSAAQGIPTFRQPLKVACAGAETWAVDGFNGAIWHYAAGAWSASLPESNGVFFGNPGPLDIAVTPNALWASGYGGMVLRRAR